MKRKTDRLVIVAVSVMFVSATILSGCSQSSESESTTKKDVTLAVAESISDPEEKPVDITSAPTETEETTEPQTTAEELKADPFEVEKEMAVSALSSRLMEQREVLYVYKDFGLTDNHFTQKARMAGYDDRLVKDMDENWTENPYSGTSCIRCTQTTREGDWGGWLFLNGYLPKGENVPKLNDGSVDGQGLDLTGAEELRFYARGDDGLRVQFFTCGFGYDGETGQRMVDYPDSAKKQSVGWIELSEEWEEYVIPLNDVDLSYIVCGFGYVLNDVKDGEGDHVFYLDEIRFTGPIEALKDAPVMLRSYDTENMYIENVAFSYDNALVAMAFLSEGMQEEAKAIVDAFVYSVENDRSVVLNGSDTEARRVRNGYAAGDVSSIPGWEAGARMPGWYDQETGEWYEDRYQVGSNVGNTSYVVLALLQYYNAFGGEEYLNTAASLMDWVIENCSNENGGFTAGFDGWEEGDPPVVYPFTYSSIEHNIDAYAAFSALYQFTSDEKYLDASKSALSFIKSMYDEENGYFYTGTTEDGITPNKSVIVLDAQVWCAMALGDEFAPYQDALRIVEEMKTDDGGYPFCMENKNGGWWAEGTSYTALMYRGIEDEEKYEEAMEALVSIQDDEGLFPAATVDNLSTGMELFDGSPWEYSTDTHIAPSAWFIMAANGFNPYVMNNVSE